MSQSFKESLTERAIGEFEGKFGRKPTETELNQYMWNCGYHNLIRQNRMATTVMTGQPVKNFGGA